MAILTLNAGSSSVKFALYNTDQGQQHCLVRGCFTDLGQHTYKFETFDGHGRLLEERTLHITHPVQTMEYLLNWLLNHDPQIPIEAIGHRIVHGGACFGKPVRLTADVLRQLHGLIPLAPLHLPQNLAAIETLQAQWPQLPQIACFDTAFHRNMPVIEQMYALPRHWFAKGIQRYGFHGLSYEYIASILPHHLGSKADARVIVAHLGHGASLCAMHRRKSVATTMGFTPLDGIPMATRPGNLDPGIITYLMREEKLSATDIDTMLNHQCGLAGLSGISGNMHELLKDNRREAVESIAYFVHHTHRAIASLAAALGGLDALVFTAGIGENCSAVRRSICTAAQWMGVRIDLHANSQNKTRISLADSKVSIWVLPTNEEQVIARHVYSVMQNDDTSGTANTSNKETQT